MIEPLNIEKIFVTALVSILTGTLSHGDQLQPAFSSVNSSGQD